MVGSTQRVGRCSSGLQIIVGIGAFALLGSIGWLFLYKGDKPTISSPSAEVESVCTNCGEESPPPPISPIHTSEWGGLGDHGFQISEFHQQVQEGFRRKSLEVPVGPADDKYSCKYLLGQADKPPPVPFAYVLGLEKGGTTDVFDVIMSMYGGVSLAEMAWKEPHLTYFCPCTTNASELIPTRPLELVHSKNTLEDIAALEYGEKMRKEKANMPLGEYMQTYLRKVSQRWQPKVRFRDFECSLRQLRSFFGMWEETVDVGGGADGPRTPSPTQETRKNMWRNKSWMVSLDGTAGEMAFLNAPGLVTALGPASRLVYLFRYPGQRVYSYLKMRSMERWMWKDARLTALGVTEAERALREARVWRRREMELLRAASRFVTSGGSLFDYSHPIPGGYYALNPEGQAFLKVALDVHVEATSIAKVRACAGFEFSDTIRNGPGSTEIPQQGWIAHSHGLWHLVRWLEVAPPQSILAMESQEWFRGRQGPLPVLEKHLCFDHMDSKLSYAQVMQEDIANKAKVIAPPQKPNVPFEDNPSYNEWKDVVQGAAAAADYALARSTILHRMLLVRLAAEFGMPVVLHQEKSDDGTMRSTSHLDAFNDAAITVPRDAFRHILFDDGGNGEGRVRCEGIASLKALRAYVDGVVVDFPIQCEVINPRQYPAQKESQKPTKSTMPDYVIAAHTEAEYRSLFPK